MKLELMNQANPISITNKLTKTKIQNTINKLNRVNLDPNADVNVNVNVNDDNNAHGVVDDCVNNVNNVDYSQWVFKRIVSLKSSKK